MTRSEIEAELTSILIEMFELDADQISMDASLYDDLDIDSIDAVDLIVRLKQFTSRTVDPEQAKQVRTVADVVDLVEDLVA